MRHISDRVVVEKQAGCYWRCGGIFGHPDKYIMGTYHCICLQYIVNRYEKFEHDVIGWLATWLLFGLFILLPVLAVAKGMLMLLEWMF